MTTHVLISEVGPRDGLQAIERTMPTACKRAWIDALYASGLREIEVGSFVSPKLLPQMADTADIVAHARTKPDLTVAVLVPNLKGALAAFASGAHKITIPVSVTEAHLMANIRKTHAEIIEDVRQIVALRNDTAPGTAIEAGLSVAFGCTLAGAVTDDESMRLAHTMADLGVDEVGLSDTTGYANPRQVARMFKRLQAELGDRAGGAHFHNTRGQGMANVLAALDAGVTTFDASMGGLGGCPYAPGATGNIVTEDLVYLLETMGCHTGIDIDRLIAARHVLADALPGEALYGHVPDAGLQKGFVYADGRLPAPRDTFTCTPETI